MTVFPGREEPRSPEELAPRPPAIDLFAHIEGLIGEEAALLSIPAHQRDHEHHRRLSEIGEELDRAWEKLRDRAERLAHRVAPGDSPS
jgi:hypothetical protein